MALLKWFWRKYQSPSVQSCYPSQKDYVFIVFRTFSVTCSTATCWCSGGNTAQLVPTSLTAKVFITFVVLGRFITSRRQELLTRNASFLTTFGQLFWLVKERPRYIIKLPISFTGWSGRKISALVGVFVSLLYRYFAMEKTRTMLNQADIISIVVCNDARLRRSGWRETVQNDSKLPRR